MGLGVEFFLLLPTPLGLLGSSKNILDALLLLFLLMTVIYIF